MARILLVEDNAMNRDMLARALTRAGHDVIMAHDGTAAVERAAADVPELILMDLSLPEMDGWEATRMIKAGAETAHIPIIALTAHAMGGDRERALSAGCDAYDTKPVDVPGLLETIRTMLDRPDEA
jgi:CheY-like chemotaxis protein